jgi:hypothetical protein
MIAWLGHVKGERQNKDTEKTIVIKSDLGVSAPSKCNVFFRILLLPVMRGFIPLVFIFGCVLV